MRIRESVILAAVSILLWGCQSTMLDDQVDIASAIDMTFCNGAGLSHLVVGSTSTSFTCHKRARLTIPVKNVFKSDAAYIAEEYDMKTEVTDGLCPDTVTLPYEYKHERTKNGHGFLVACKGIVAYVEAGTYRNTISDQLEYAFDMSSLCTESAPFQLAYIHQEGAKKSIQFKCGQSRYDISTRFLSDITLDDIQSINALSCDYTGFKSFDFNNRRAVFQCGNGFKNTLNL